MIRPDALYSLNLLRLRVETRRKRLLQTIANPEAAQAARQRARREYDQTLTDLAALSFAIKAINPGPGRPRKARTEGEGR